MSGWNGHEAGKPEAWQGEPVPHVLRGPGVVSVPQSRWLNLAPQEGQKHQESSASSSARTGCCAARRVPPPHRQEPVPRGWGGQCRLQEQQPRPFLPLSHQARLGRMNLAASASLSHAGLRWALHHSCLPRTTSSDGSRSPTQSPITKAASHCGPHHPDLSPGSPPPEQPLCTPQTRGTALGLVRPLFTAAALVAVGTQPCLPVTPKGASPPDPHRRNLWSHSGCCWDPEREPPQGAEYQHSREPDRAIPPPQLPKQRRQAGEEASVCL